jgi:circadian clock protein KaiC
MPNDKAPEASGGQVFDLPRVETRVPGLDSTMAGGLPAGRTTLVAGGAGSGKTVLGLQYLVGGARDLSEPGVMVALTEHPDDLIKNTESFGWGVRELVESGRLRILEAAPTPEPYVSGPGTFDFTALSARIRHAVSEIDAKRLVIDPLDALLSAFGDEPDVRRELYSVIRDLRPLGVTTLITAERLGEYDRVARRGFEEYLTDNVVILRNNLELEVRRRTIEVLKFRGADHSKGQYPFVIDPRRGVQILPVSIIEKEAEASHDRVSLGQPQLDEMTFGGIYRDSLILVSGATGTGKTLMALQFLIAGLDAGERVVLFSFEESAAQVTRNAHSWGWDLETPMREGRLQIISRYPERMGLEDLLMKIRSDVEAVDAGRIAIDGLSGLEANVSVKGFREFAVGLSSYLKGRGVAAILTTTRAGLSNGAGATEANLSTITDAIVILKYVDLEGELHRGILVLKLRGGGHSHKFHEYEIGNTGMQVLGPFHGVGGILVGAAGFITPRADPEQVEKPSVE